MVPQFRKDCSPARSHGAARARCVANHIEDSVSDARAAEAVLESMEHDLGKLPGALVADAGYGNKETLESCQARDVTPVCATIRTARNMAVRVAIARCGSGRSTSTRPTLRRPSALTSVGSTEHQNTGLQCLSKQSCHETSPT